MGREDQQAAWRHEIEVVDEDRAAGPQAVADVTVVHDLVAHVDRRPVVVEDQVDDLDGVGNAGAEASRTRDQQGPIVDGDGFSLGSGHAARACHGISQRTSDEAPTADDDARDVR